MDLPYQRKKNSNGDDMDVLIRLHSMKGFFSHVTIRLVIWYTINSNMKRLLMYL